MKWAAEQRGGNSPMPYVFDVNGTLLDVDAATREAASETVMEVPAANWPELAAAWRTRQLSYTWLRTAMQRYTDFWVVTEGALDVTLAEMGLDGNAALRARLLSLYTTLSAYDEVPAVLTRMARDDQGMAVLSNGSPSMLETALGAAGIASRFDRVLSVDALKRYKPDPLVYQMATDVYGCAPADIIFFSSNNWDISGAGAFGFTTIWVNRAGRVWDDLPARPAHMVSGLRAALDLI